MTEPILIIFSPERYFYESIGNSEWGIECAKPLRWDARPTSSR